MRIAVLPARGGSKRIPNKNILDFCGKPMIGHPLTAARDSGLFQKIHVSTDSDPIRECVERLGFPVDFKRAKELADDHTPLMPVLQWTLREYAKRGEHYDEVCLILPTSPLLTAEDLLRAHSLFQSAGGEKPVMSIAPYPVPVEWAFRLKPDGELIPREPGKFAIRSQDLGSAYFDAGAFYFYPSKLVLSDAPPRDEGYLGCALPKDRVCDIDDLEDLKLAEVLFQHIHGTRSRGSPKG